jgi:Formin Homology 2 Domain
MINGLVEEVGQRPHQEGIVNLRNIYVRLSREVCVGKREVRMSRQSVTQIFDELEMVKEQLLEEKAKNEKLMKSERWLEAETIRLKQQLEELKGQGQGQGTTTTKPLLFSGPPLPMFGKAPPPLPPMMGKAMPPPPPFAAAKAPQPVSQQPMAKTAVSPMPTATLSSSAAATELINLHWKTGSGISREPLTEDSFLKPFLVFVKSSLGNRHVIKHSPPSLDDSVFVSEPSSSLRCTNQLMKFFKRKQIKIDIKNNNAHENAQISSKKSSALDAERQKMISLAIGGTLGSRTNRKTSFFDYKQAILACDYSLLPLSVLCPLLQLLKTVTEEEISAVQASIKTDLEANQGEDCDAFVYYMTSVPDVKLRLECMIFQLSFQDLLSCTNKNMDAISEGLDVIAGKKAAISQYFCTALSIGNQLNENSRIAAQRNFSLSSILKFHEVKSSVDSRITLFHMLVALVSSSSGEAAVFSDLEIAILRRAGAVRAHRVRDEAKDLLDSVGAIQEASKSPDSFGEKMALFYKEIHFDVTELAKRAFEVFSSLKHWANMLEDVKAVYPPPKEKSPEVVDLFEFMANFGCLVKTNEKELKKFKVRLDVVSAPPSPRVASFTPSVSSIMPEKPALSPDKDENLKQQEKQTPKIPQAKPIPVPVLAFGMTPPGTPQDFHSRGSNTSQEVSPQRRRVIFRKTTSSAGGTYKGDRSAEDPGTPRRLSFFDDMPDPLGMRPTTSRRVSLAETVNKISQRVLEEVRVERESSLSPDAKLKCILGKRDRD